MISERGSRGRNVILPKIDNGRNHERNHHKLPRGIRKRHHHRGQYPAEHMAPITSRSTFDPATPLTLELKHGQQMHKVNLPTQSLDKSKKYYVTFTIDRANGFKDVIEESSFEDEAAVASDEQVVGLRTNHVIPAPPVGN